MYQTGNALVDFASGVGASLGDAGLQYAAGRRQYDRDQQDRAEVARRLQRELDELTRRDNTAAIDDLTKQGATMRALGDDAGAAALMPGLNQARQGLGLSSLAPVMGAPVTKQQAGPVPFGAPALPRVPTGETTYAEAGSQGGLAAAFGLPPVPKLTEVSPGATLYDPRANKGVFTAPGRATNAPLEQDPVTGQWFTPAPGMKSGVKPAGAGHLVQDPVTGEWFAPTVGAVTGVKPKEPSPFLDLAKSQQQAQWQQGILTYADAYAARQAAAADKAGEDVTPDMLERYRAEGEARYRKIRPEPGASSTTIAPQPNRTKRLSPFSSANPSPASRPDPKPPGRGGAAGAGGGSGGGGGAGAPLSAVPTRYEDTALLPEVESVAKAITDRFPGAVISSRARSRDRNKAAGGVEDGSHVYRQGFDVVAPGKQWAAIEALAKEMGMEAIREPHPENPRRAHVHIQVPKGQRKMLVGQAGDESAKLEALFAKYGVSPDA